MLPGLGRMTVLVGGVPITADGWPLALMSSQQCTLAWLPTALASAVAGRPSFALLEARDADGNLLPAVRRAPSLPLRCSGSACTGSQTLDSTSTARDAVTHFGVYPPPRSCSSFQSYFLRRIPGRRNLGSWQLMCVKMWAITQ